MSEAVKGAFGVLVLVLVLPLLLVGLSGGDVSAAKGSLIPLFITGILGLTVIGFALAILRG